MLIETCLIIITLVLVTLLASFIAFSLKSSRALKRAEKDFHDVSHEVTSFLTTLQEFVRSDLHSVSQETTQLIHRLGGPPPQGGRPPLREAIPQVIKWIASSTLLFKKTKEIIKNYGKHT